MQDKTGLIDYATFCENIESVFGENADPKEVIGGSRSTAVRKTPFDARFLNVINVYRTSQKKKWT